MGAIKIEPSEVTYSDFIKRIAKDFNIDITKEYTLKLPNDKGIIKAFTTSRAAQVRIFDGVKEHPYMLELGRNNASLEKGIELRFSGWKSFDEIIVESGAKIQIKKCRICEGGGWSSSGYRYTYDDVFIEI